MNSGTTASRIENPSKRSSEPRVPSPWCGIHRPVPSEEGSTRRLLVIFLFGSLFSCFHLFLSLLTSSHTQNRVLLQSAAAQPTNLHGRWSSLPFRLAAEQGAAGRCPPRVGTVWQGRVHGSEFPCVHPCAGALAGMGTGWLLRASAPPNSRSPNAPTNN